MNNGTAPCAVISRSNDVLAFHNPGDHIRVAQRVSASSFIDVPPSQKRIDAVSYMQKIVLNWKWNDRVKPSIKFSPGPLADSHHPPPLRILLDNRRNRIPLAISSGCSVPVVADRTFGLYTSNVL